MINWMAELTELTIDDQMPSRADWNKHIDKQKLAPDGFENLSDVVSYEELEHISVKYKKFAGFDRDSLNNQQ